MLIGTYFFRFFAIVDEFLKKNAENDLLIGTHCTHGVNRTGYLICRYMIDRLQIAPEDALMKFQDARGYPVERQNYIDDLKTGKCHEDKEFAELTEDVAPKLYRKQTDIKCTEIGSRPTYDNKQTYSSLSSNHRPRFISNSTYNRNFDGYDIPKRNGPRFFCPVPLKYMNVPHHNEMYQNYIKSNPCYNHNAQNQVSCDTSSSNDENWRNNDRLSVDCDNTNNLQNRNSRNQDSCQNQAFDRFQDAYSKNNKRRFNRNRTNSDNISLNDSHFRPYSRDSRSQSSSTCHSRKYDTHRDGQSNDNIHRRDERSWSCPSSHRKK